MVSAARCNHRELDLFPRRINLNAIVGPIDFRWRKLQAAAFDICFEWQRESRRSMILSVTRRFRLTHQIVWKHGGNDHLMPLQRPRAPLGPSKRDFAPGWCCPKYGIKRIDWPKSLFGDAPHLRTARTTSDAPWRSIRHSAVAILQARRSSSRLIFIVPTRLWFDWCFAFHHIATESGTHSGAIVLAHQSVLQVFFRGFLSDSIAFSINQGFTRYNRVFLGLPEIYSGQNYSEVFFCLLARATCFRCFWSVSVFLGVLWVQVAFSIVFFVFYWSCWVLLGFEKAFQSLCHRIQYWLQSSPIFIGFRRFQFFSSFLVSFSWSYGWKWVSLSEWISLRPYSTVFLSLKPEFVLDPGFHVFS